MYALIRLMDKILHDPKDPKLWELWYIPYNGSCRILSINRKVYCIKAPRTLKPKLLKACVNFKRPSTDPEGPSGFRV